MVAQTGASLGARGLLIAAGTATTVGVGAVAYVTKDQWLNKTDPVVAETPAALVDQPAPAAEALEPAPAELGFDVVRVDPTGQAVIAGHAAPGSNVDLTMDGEKIETVTADDRGNFVAMLELPTDATGALGLASLDEDGASVTSEQTVIVTPSPVPPVAEADPEPPAEPVVDEALAAVEPTVEPPISEPAPRVMLADDEGITILQDGAGQARLENVLIDTISYDDDGGVQLGGRGQPGAELRIYLDNRAVQTATVLSDGQWRTTLTDVAVGVYTLRVDELTSDGKVASRIETPFKREAPEQLAAAAEVQQADTADGPPARVSAVTVQPGSTLWAIAREHLGDGPLYVQVFDANRDQIRNPDLIYPGQVFSLPSDG